jgi:adenosylcobinamide-phosphate guanylyltransferase
MDVTALVMAGGRGSRMKLQEEKPLLEVEGKPMIQYVLDALKRARKVKEIVVLVSKYTPKTAQEMKRLSIKVLETPGKDYVYDMKYAIKKLKLQKVLIISADLPLVTNEIIDEAVEYYERCGKPALSVAVPVEIQERLGLEVNYVFEREGKRLVPAGINLVDGRRIDEAELDEEILIMTNEKVAINVNTYKDLNTVKQLLHTQTN